MNVSGRGMKEVSVLLPETVLSNAEIADRLASLAQLLLSRWVIGRRIVNPALGLRWRFLLSFPGEPCNSARIQ